MVQPNSQYGKSIYFPYAAGSLVAYAFKNETVKNEYSFCGFIYEKLDFENALDILIDPFFIGFSCYVWNYEYNCALAKKVKEKFPNCFIAFGGHQINQYSEVTEASYVDFIILGEGEESFEKLLLALSSFAPISNVPNLIYRENGIQRKTSAVVDQIPERVSPYLEGYFDDILKDTRYDFSAILETNRGCPNRCAFCDWGNIKSKVRLFNSDTVRKEIEWFSENKIEYCYCADANFGLFSRDMEFIDYLIKAHNDTGYPQKFQATYSKNNAMTVFEINKKLNDAGMSKGATLSFQSMDQNVLNNIYRKNMPLSNFHKLMALYNTNGISTYSELILGLPGETYNSFKDGIEQLLQSGQHMSINFFNCELLKNSIMSDSEYMERYKIHFRRIEQHQYHVVKNKNDIREFSNIVVSTNSMPEDMWIQSNILSVYVRFLHNLGLLQCIAIYLFFEKNKKYTDFYSDLIKWSANNPNSVCGEIYSWLIRKYNEVLEGDGSLTCVVEHFGDLTWPLDEGAFLKAIEKYELFYKEMKPLIEVYFEDKILFEELYKYQMSIVKNPFLTKTTLSVHYDFYEYFKNIYSNNYKPLRNKECKLVIDQDSVPKDLPRFAKEIIWFGRKGGKNIATVKYGEK